MTNLPDDLIDAAEARFARRVRDYPDPAVLPVDHAAVATAATGPGGPRRSGAGRFGWLFAGAAAVAGLAVVALLINTMRGPDVGASPSIPVAAAGTDCAAMQLSATVGGWEGAAGHRIGTLTVTNPGATACSLPASIRPSLIDRNGHDLIVGAVANLARQALPPGGSVSTLVQTGNYCGPTAQEPAAVALDLGILGKLIAKPVAGDDSSGVPPCMGEAGPTDDMTIQPWGTAQG
jgi:hypothetical protein